MAHGETLHADDWTVIRRSMLFERLREETAHRLLAGSAIQALPKGALLCRHGDPALACHIIITGLVKIFRSGEENGSTIIAMHGPGRTFLLAEGLAGTAYTASAETVTASRILRLDAARLRGQIAADNSIAFAMLASASVHLRSMIAHVEELKTMTGPDRLIDFLLNLAGRRAGRAEISLPYEKHLIANYLGMKPESFSRAMAMLKQQGVNVSRDRIVIPDIARLRNVQRLMY